MGPGIKPVACCSWKPDAHAHQGLPGNLALQQAPAAKSIQLTAWSDGMILASGARGPALNSRNSPVRRAARGPALRARAPGHSMPELIRAQPSSNIDTDSNIQEQRHHCQQQQRQRQRYQHHQQQQQQQQRRNQNLGRGQERDVAASKLALPPLQLRNGMEDCGVGERIQVERSSPLPKPSMR